MKISIIGAGNVAWHLAQKLESVGHSIQEVFSRNLDHAQELCQKLALAQAQNHLDFRASQAECFILSIKDDAIPSVVAQLQLPAHALIAHTSGSQTLDSLNPLKQEGWATGVFYTLQTFSKAKSLSFQYIPLCIEGDSSQSQAALMSLAQELSERVYQVSSAQRKILHLAAVFACNFSNYLWTISEDILQSEGLSLEILAPLMQETLDKALATNPRVAQTGPARRHDQSIINAHLQYLQTTHPEHYHQIYELFSQCILTYYTT